MSTGIHLDHVGIAVRDLAQARTDFERLGFTTTPLSLHAAPPRPGAPLEPSGSGNHCIMLEAGYIELLGVTGPGETNSAARMLARYEGAHILALGSRDAAASRDAIAAQGFAIAAPQALERDAPWGSHGQQTRRATFANAHLDGTAFPEAHSFVIEHMTRDIVWQPHQMLHANGASGLAEAWICPKNPDEAASRYARLAGSTATTDGGDLVVPLERGRLRIMTVAAFGAVAGVDPVSVPGLAGLAVTVRDLAATEALLRSRAVPFRTAGGGLLVEGPIVHGAALLFVPRT